MEIKITLDEYLLLRKSALRLRRLENGGVGNWEWYCESLNDVFGTGVCIEDAEGLLEKELYEKYQPN